MPRNKDAKRLIRARMGRTGESYTAARAVVLAKRAGGPAQTAAPRGEWAKLAGVRDAAVRAKTGLMWAEWVDALDRAGARAMTHRDIARHISAAHPGIGGWWAQTVTVGYERIRGLRAPGQRVDGTYDANRSRTFAVPASTLYRMFHDARQRRKWLPAGLARVRTATTDRSLRADWHDGTRVSAYFTPKGPGRSTVSVQHSHLAGAGAAEEMKRFWSARLDALGIALG